MPQIIVPPHIRQIAQQLTAHGFETVVVGGSVRDALLGRAAKDWDLATSALPSEVQVIFPQTVATTRFGTALIPVEGELIEVTTYRTEADYDDFRRPSTIDYTQDLRVDLSRRDLTINAIAYDPVSDELIDPFNGREDLNKGLLRAVGVAADRFHEDALRLLRVVRFISSLGFSVETETAWAISQNAHLANHLASERIGTEIKRLLAGPYYQAALDRAMDFGLLKYLLPEFTSPNDLDHVNRAVQALPVTGASYEARWAALLHNHQYDTDATQMAQRAAWRLGVWALGDDLGQRVAQIILASLVEEGYTGQTEADLWRALRPFSPEIFLEGLLVRDACWQAQSISAPNFAQFDSQAIALYNSGLPRNLAELNINGDDLIALGLKPGRKLGDLLDELLEATTDRLVANEYEALVKLARTSINL
jgi:tRNA nucleotidyltransferase (CCA-adding enzyme)